MPKKTRSLPNDWREKVEAIIKKWVSPDAFNSSVTILNRPEAQEAAEALWALSSVNNENGPIIFAKLLYRIAVAKEVGKRNAFNRTVKQTEGIVRALMAVMDDGFFKQKSIREELTRTIDYYKSISTEIDFKKLLPKTKPKDYVIIYTILALCDELESATGRSCHKITSLLMNAARLGVWTEDSVKTRYSEHSYLRKSLAMYDLKTTDP